MSERRPRAFHDPVVRTHCRSCGGALGTVLADLGVQPPSNSYLYDLSEAATERAYPLRCVVCSDCLLAQVDTDVPPAELFHDYAYFSSYSESWLAHAQAYCDMAIARFSLNSESFVVELASNDGYLLKNMVARGIPCLGVEPSATVAAAGRAMGVSAMVAFFDEALGQSIAASRGQADLIVANNVWAHIPDLQSFTAGIATLLKDNGVATIEVQHLLRLMEQVAFDTIYHEHFEYYSLLAAERVLQRAGLKVFDLEELRTHGGSLRLYITHERNTDRSASEAVLRVRADEAAAKLGSLSTYTHFAERVAACRASTVAFLQTARAEGKKVYAYGAAAKGNTLLNYCSVTAADIAQVADRNPHKQGKFLPGSHIPIVSPEALLAAQPDYVIILAWNIADEVIAQLSAVRGWGGKFVTPVPFIQIL